MSLFIHHLLLDHVQFSLIHGPNIPHSYAILFFAASDFTFITRHIHNWVSFLLWPSCFIHSEAIGNSPPLSPVVSWTPSHLGDSPSVSYLFGLLYSSWHSHSKYPGVVCRSLLQWITFCQNSLLWPVHLGWPCTAWLIASLSYSSPFATKVVSHEGDT